MHKMHNRFKAGEVKKTINNKDEEKRVTFLQYFKCQRDIGVLFTNILYYFFVIVA